MEQESKRMNEELKPCPFCGGEVGISQIYDWSFRVYCSNCDIEIDGFSTEEEAIDEWNRRVEE